MIFALNIKLCHNNGFAKRQTGKIKMEIRKL